jgi:signal transduction histidine kinase
MGGVAMALSRVATPVGRPRVDPRAEAEGGDARPTRGHEAWTVSRRAVATVAVALLLLLTAGGIAYAQADSREQLRDRFALRNALGARFAEAYTAEIVTREAAVGARELAGATVSSDTFARVAGSLGFDVAVLLDADGDAIAAVPPLSVAAGKDLGGRYPHLASALAGQPAISNVVASAAEGVPVVAFAAPFETPFGRRVVSGAFPVARTPLAAYLDNAMPITSAAIYLIDGAGRIAASNRDEGATATTLAAATPDLATAMAAGAETFERGGRTHFLAVQEVAGTPFTLVSSVALVDIYTPIEGPALWMPWLVLAALTVAALYLLRVLTSLSRSQLALRGVTAELERSNVELRDFAAVASHDLQEPLRKIQAFGERLEEQTEGALDAAAADSLARIRQAAGRMQTLVQDLLEYSAVATQAPEPVRLDLDRLLAEVVVDLEERTRATGGRVVVGDMPTVTGSALQMRQLFQNLIANGLKFHRDGVPPEVRVEVTRARGGRSGTWEFQVSDNGVGFDDRHAERIFAPFHRLHSRQAFAGTGIGLAICRRIVERHGGAISAHGVPGAGATFTVTLPAT